MYEIKLIQNINIHDFGGNIYMTKNIKRTITVLIMVLVFGLFTGCKTFQAPDIGISTSDNIGMTKKIVDDLIKMAKSDQLKVTDLDAEGNFDTQTLHIQSLIEQECNVIAICPVNTEEIKKSIAVANEAGIAVVVFEKSINDDSIAFFAGYDALNEGKSAAQAIVEADDGKENIVIEIVGPNDNQNAMDASRGFHDLIDVIDNITVVQVYSNWNPQSTYEGMKSVLKKYPTISAVYSSNSTLDTAIDEALIEIGLLKPIGSSGHIYRVSSSGSKNGYESAVNGYVDLLLVTAAEEQAKALYDAIVLLGSGKTLESDSFVARTYSITQDQVEINKENIWGFTSGIE